MCHVLTFAERTHPIASTVGVVAGGRAERHFVKVEGHGVIEGCRKVATVVRAVHLCCRVEFPKIALALGEVGSTAMLTVPGAKRCSKGCGNHYQQKLPLK
jgi:hypothetical protein